MIGNEENDTAMVEAVAAAMEEYKAAFQMLRLETLLTGEYDANDAILSIHPGAGGTESQDWASMLLRMYTRWGEDHGYTVKLIDYLDGDEAGIKSAVLQYSGENAYGFLRSEHGVHRLVRISPFDSAGRRHTSFASVEVMPEIDDNIEIDIRPEDLEIGTYRSSGAGGQHINKTDSAVRMTHIPTGIVVTCQNEKSQLKNKEQALKVLYARVYERERRAHDAAISADRRSQVGTGDRSERIRTYNFPQGRVTDHRIGLTLHKIDAIMDGDLNEMMDTLATTDRMAKMQET